MMPEANANPDEQQPDRQDELPPELPVTPPATSSTPPGGGIVARVQQMPPFGRWALGLGLAFLSGLAFLFSPYVSNFGPALPTIFVVVMFVLALAAGVVLSSWWATLALAVAASVGGALASWVLPQISSGGGSEGLAGIGVIVAAFGVFGLVPIIFFLLAGVALGKQQGIALGQPYMLSAGEARVSRWIAALGPVIAAGYLAPPVAYIPGFQGNILGVLPFLFYAIVLAAACLLSGWLLRSWWGFVVGSVVYAAVAAFASLWFGGFGDMQVWPVGYVLYILLPALAMSAIGTAIGMYRAR